MDDESLHSTASQKPRIIHGKIEDVLVKRWHEALERSRESLTPSDFKIVEGFDSPEALLADLRLKEQDNRNTWMSGLINRLYFLLSRLEEFSSVLAIALLLPNSIETKMIWGVLYLTLTLSFKSERTAQSVAEMLNKMRRTLELLYRCAQCYEVDDEIKLAIIEVMERLIGFWVEAIKHLRKNPAGRAAAESWSHLNDKFTTALTEMDASVTHLHRLASMRKSSSSVESSAAHNISSLKYDLPERREIDSCRFLPYPENQHFFGRQHILKSIEEKLNSQNQTPKLKLFTVYGLGGVGKTQCALAFGHANIASFDCIFWIRSETRSSLRESFIQIAAILDMPGVKSTTDPDDCRLFIQTWLQKTESKWLLIYDNVESIQLLKDFWPSGSGQGSILVTTRYKHVAVTLNSPYVELKTFTENESLDLFERILGWNDTPVVPPEEKVSASLLMKRFGGLALAIQQAAAMIAAEGWTVKRYYTSYLRDYRRFHQKSVDQINYDHSLATVWSLAFQNLSASASALLSLLSLLSPDSIPISIFENKNGSNETPKFNFMKDNYELEDTMDELMRVALVRRESDILSIHRLVQEALLCTLTQLEKQEAFDCAVDMIYTVFPKKISGQTLQPQHTQCQLYIQHSLKLATIYADSQTKTEKLVASMDFTDMLRNCAWYLSELNELQECLRIIDIAVAACPEPNSLLYAHLCNCAQVCTFQLPNLPLCHRWTEVGDRIRHRLLPPDSWERTNCDHNDGNLATAEGRLDEALVLYKKAEHTRLQAGTSAAMAIVLSHLCIGRVLFYQGMYADAMARYDKAEALIVPLHGLNGPFMADIHYARGNLERKRGNLAAARTHYEVGITVLEPHMPRHQLTSALFYKAACVYFEEGDINAAK